MASGPRIFVSHSHTDNVFGLKLVDDLRKLIGDESAVWYDSHGGLYGGDTWWPKIIKELSERNVFILILSPEAVVSKWVNDELNLAWWQRNKAGMLIIPVLYRKCAVPEYLNLVQIISFLPPRPYEEAFNELLQALKLIAQPVSPSRKTRSTPFSKISPTLKKVSAISKEKLIQLIAVLMIVLSIVLSSLWIKQGIAVSQAAATSQSVKATAIATHYPFSTHEVLNDQLTTASQHDRWGWDSKNCQFTSQGYVSDELITNYFNPCIATDTNFTNFTYQVTMTITSGDCGFLIFRANLAQSAYYLFGLCQNGYYYLVVYGTKYGRNGKVLIGYTPSGFNIGLNYPISFEIFARGSTVGLYLNGIFITRISDSTYGGGQIGMGARSILAPTQVIFTNAKVWQL